MKVKKYIEQGSAAVTEDLNLDIFQAYLLILCLWVEDTGEQLNITMICQLSGSQTRQH